MRSKDVIQSARQPRDVRPSPTPFAFTPSSRRSSARSDLNATVRPRDSASQVLTRRPSDLAANRTPRDSLTRGPAIVPSRTPPGQSMNQPQRRWSTASDSQLENYYSRTPLGAAPLSSRSPSASTLTSSVYTGASTPVAGKTWGHLTRTFGNGTGRQHFDQVSHIALGFMGIEDIPGAHGHAKDDSFEEGIERGIGHGKRYLGHTEKCHLKGGKHCFEDSAGTHGHSRGEDFVDGLERCIGKGRRKFNRRHHITDDAHSDAGGHGHPRHADFQDGIEHEIGHGKRRVNPYHNRETWRETPLFHPDSPDCTNVADMRIAGMSSRDIQMHHMARDPRRQGTHQDGRVRPVIYG
mmetsp:Transcript_64847/g.102788  ORF Transcript_64847/g.102788 Transcript_64847/m.102788 type:complete len:351 (+) Transcript_64847:494-1546(+)